MPRVLPSAIGIVIALSVASAVAKNGAVTTLTPKEQADGWKLLFDGSSLKGWRGFKSDAPPAGWKAIDGALVRDGNGGDIMTADQYGDFELRLDWKISPGGNSGIMFHVTTEESATYETGPEFQVLDNGGHRDGKNPMTSAGSNYAVHPVPRDVTKAVGQWNEVRLIVRGPHVEHWMNGTKLIEYELWSDEWKQRVAASKFACMPHYGLAKTGHIALQDHGNLVWYRNIKIKPL